jgi:hypothetical protein
MERKWCVSKLKVNKKSFFMKFAGYISPCIRGTFKNSAHNLIHMAHKVELKIHKGFCCVFHSVSRHTIIIFLFCVRGNDK